MSVQHKGDDRLVAVFKLHPVKDDARSAAEGRPVFNDIEVCEIRTPGSRNVSVFPATAVSHWSGDIYGGEQVQVTYAERFAHQYRLFKAEQVQTKVGTPLDHVKFLTPGKCAELRAQNIYTLEQLAGIEGMELKNLGPGGRELKNRAEAYIAEARENAPNLQMANELEQMKARNAVLEEDMKALKAAQLKKAEDGDSDPEFDEMSLDQLRDLIKANTGHAPHGSLNRKTLVRMARDSQQKAA